MPSTPKRFSSKRKMSFDIHPIRSESDYLKALAQIKALMDAKPNTPEEGRLDVLGTLIDAYEREHFPMEMPDPVEAIKFRMEQMGVSRKEWRSSWAAAIASRRS
jgi:HTH-type transcriptional regulator/antitoxin HigA